MSHYYIAVICCLSLQNHPVLSQYVGYESSVTVDDAWSSAEAYCLAKHCTHLVSIHNQSESDAVAQICGSLIAIDCWIGFHGNNASGCTWSDGSDNSYRDFYNGIEENKGNSSVFCGHFDMMAGKWKGDTCTNPGNAFSFVCFAGCTDSPTTAIPTTALPTTAIPTTAIPTNPTATPTTTKPTTFEPTTDSPTTGLPTTMSPTTGLPTTDSPTTAIPTTESPTTGLPTTDSPTTDNPTTSIPTISPLASGEAGLTTTPQNDFHDGNEDGVKQSDGDNTFIIILSVISVVVVIIIVFAIFYVVIQKKKLKILKATQLKMDSQSMSNIPPQREMAKISSISSYNDGIEEEKLGDRNNGLTPGNINITNGGPDSLGDSDVDVDRLKIAGNENFKTEYDDKININPNIKADEFVIGNNEEQQTVGGEGDNAAMNNNDVNVINSTKGDMISDQENSGGLTDDKYISDNQDDEIIDDIINVTNTNKNDGVSNDYQTVGNEDNV